MLVGPDLSDRAGEERGLGAGDLRDLLSGNQMAKVSCTLGQRHRLSHRGDLGPRLVPLHLCRDVPHGELVVGELLEQVIESRSW